MSCLCEVGPKLDLLLFAKWMDLCVVLTDEKVSCHVMLDKLLPSVYTCVLPV